MPSFTGQYFNTSNPTQIGFTPASYHPTGNVQGGSQVIIGRDVTASWEAIGYGSGARPDILENFVINLTNTHTGIDKGNKVSIILNYQELISIATGNPFSFPGTGLNLVLKEVSVCEMVSGESQEKRMIIIGSQTYDPP